MDEEVLGKAYDARLMRRLLRYLLPYRKLVAASLFFLILQSGLQVLGPLLTKAAVDRYLQPQPVPTFLDSFLPSDAWSGISLIGLLYLAVVAGTFVCEFGQTYLTQFTGQHAMFAARISNVCGTGSNENTRPLRPTSSDSLRE